MRRTGVCEPGRNAARPMAREFIADLGPVSETRCTTAKESISASKARPASCRADSVQRGIPHSFRDTHVVAGSQPLMLPKPSIGGRRLLTPTKPTRDGCLTERSHAMSAARPGSIRESPNWSSILSPTCYSEFGSQSERLVNAGVMKGVNMAKTLFLFLVATCAVSWNVHIVSGQTSAGQILWNRPGPNRPGDSLSSTWRSPTPRPGNVPG